MSKLDRELQQAVGDSRVEIRLEAEQEVDVGALYQLLRNAIDEHQHRVPIDLRQVHGAPDELVDVLISSQKYARSKGKLLTIIAALPEMHDALHPRRRRQAGRSDEAIDDSDSTDAGEVAKSTLDTRYSEDQAAYDLSHATKISASEARKNRRRKKLKRYSALGVVVIIAVGIIGYVEYRLVFSAETPTVVVPVKTFESAKPGVGP